MNRLLSLLIVLLISCSNETEIKGYWRLNFNDEAENHFLPYELSFDQDTLLIVDGHNFKQTSVYTVFGDSISITFENGIKKNYSFSPLSDSTIRFADRDYFRTSKDYFSTTQSYELLGWLSEQEFSPQINSTTIHLIKDADSTKVILNDITTDLKYLPDFLSLDDGQRPTIYLYVGEGIELKDLLGAYCWIKYSGYQKVELVTSNISFEKFYSVNDYIDMDDSIFMKFLDENNLHPPPPALESNEKIFDLFVDSGSDITFDQQPDIYTYRYNFSSQLDINEYLELTEKLNNSKNKKLKRLTTLYKTH